MLSLSIHQRYYLFRQPTDMRNGFDGLSGIIQNHMNQDPLGGDVFVFFNRRRNQIKLLCWDGDGFMMFSKRLEKGTFELPKDPHVQLSVDILTCVLQGIKLSSIHKRKRYVHAA